jgi:Fur family ferric uptake transcriptional regulator/Fur family peroxide stress response transcriptional regulator
MDNYHQLLNQSGLKATNQRIGVLEVLQETGHSTIDEIYHSVKKQHPAISLATVYKNIDIMLEKGVLVEVPIAGAKSQYEIKKHDHIHLICQECGSVTDEVIGEMPRRQLAEIAQKDDFSLSSSQINLYGICHNCQAAS